ncbi:hypothetical protein A0H81_11094 [Grifola frondosa]|uniref:DUF6534 domain-containing protein n=1 Tax=Grifola frondosa TaxID=5627 RepID=A0A1C7LWL3_GRIFR|nr:hypothetical protein A0H81_11094 [Grifola frondosa]
MLRSSSLSPGLGWQGSPPKPREIRGRKRAICDIDRVRNRVRLSGRPLQEANAYGELQYLMRWYSYNTPLTVLPWRIVSCYPTLLSPLWSLSLRRRLTMSVIDTTFGAALVGLVVASCLYGITLLQTYGYYKYDKVASLDCVGLTSSRQYPDDHLFVKSLVFTLLILDTLHVILCTRAIYWYLVTNFGSVDNLDITTWSMALQTDCNHVSQGLIGLIVEVFFARRVWLSKLSTFILISYLPSWTTSSEPKRIHNGHNCRVGGTTFRPGSSLYRGILVRFTLGRFSRFGELTWVTCLGLGAAAAADILIAITMCFYLFRKRTGILRSDSVVTRLMIYSVNTGLLTSRLTYLSVIATICVVTFAAMPTNFVWLSFFWVMGKCYVNSFLALLNSRGSLREKVSRAAVQLGNVGNGRSFHSFNISSGPVLVRKPSDGGLEVNVETTTEYITDYPQTAYNPD